ncbi:MAG: hypothetical protein LIP10_12965 [Clostridiales bacterium]|nr:hypothetical protein [Clostridiales bacterium]
MRIINKADCESYEQWVEGFVRGVLESGNIDCAEVTIDDLDGDRIWLTVDGAEYHIRTWNFEPVHYDAENRPDAEIVSYSLFKVLDDYAEEIEYNSRRIEWVN